jgi:hypothetical protein
MPGAVRGVQVGSYNAQVNNFYAPAPVMVVPSQVVTGAIPARPVGFQPRAALMDALAEVVGSDRVAVVCALTGQRGVGKTQLAATYARRRVEQKCPVVAWVNAERPESILAGLDALASALGLHREGEDAASGVARLVAELQTRVEPALVVFDNVTDPDHLVGYLPATGATRIILTSTQQSVRNLGQALPVDVYTPGEAIAFLRETTGWDDDAGAGVLASELGWLPLALAHAAAVIRTREITYPNCVRLIRNYPLPRYCTSSTSPVSTTRTAAPRRSCFPCTTRGSIPTPSSPASPVWSRCSHPMGFPVSCSAHSPRVIPPCWMIGFSIWLAGRSSPTPRVEAR